MGGDRDVCQPRACGPAPLCGAGHGAEHRDGGGQRGLASTGCGVEPWLRCWWERWPRNWFGSFRTLPFSLSGLQRAPAQSHTCKHAPREPLGQGGAPCPKSCIPLPCFCSPLSSSEAPCCTHGCPVLGGGFNGPHWEGRISQRGTVVGTERAFGTIVEVTGTGGPVEPH